MMLIKLTKLMTDSERIAAENSNNQFLQALAYVAVGTIFPYAGKTAPDTFMFCDGSSLDTTEYADLFKVIGYSFGGSGDAFNLPDLRGKTIVGLNSSDEDFNAVGKTGGLKEVKLTEEQMPKHQHAVALSDNGTLDQASFNWVYNQTARLYTGTDLAQYAGGDQPHNNMPPFSVVNYIIKVTQAVSNAVFRIPTDQSYNPESTNAQSGVAVAEAIEKNKLYTHNTFANAIKGSKSGSVISVNDVSPIEHDIKVTLSNEPTVNRFDIYGVGGDSVDPNHADRTIDVNTSDTVNLGKLTDICTGVKGGDTIKISFESDNINSVLSLALLKSDNSYTSICRVYSLTGSSAMGEDSYVICTLPEDISNIYVQHEGGEATLSDIFIGLESVLEDFSGVTVSRYGKNLFNPNLTEGTLESGGGNTSVRSDFEFDKYYVGFARNNYYYPYQVNSYNYDGDTFTFNLKAIYYGIGIPIKVKPNTKYIARAELSEECFLMAGFYTSEGEYINAITNSTNAFTTPANCGIVMLFLTSNNTNKVCTASNIQLEIGTTATDYEPYKEPQTATANADGTVEGLTSVSPNMTLVSDTERVVINLEYNIDTKMYIDNELAKIKAELSATIVNS